MSGPGTPQLSGASTSMANILSRLGTTVLSKVDEFPLQKSVVNLRKLMHIFMKRGAGASNTFQSFLGGNSSILVIRRASAYCD